MNSADPLPPNVARLLARPETGTEAPHPDHRKGAVPHAVSQDREFQRGQEIRAGCPGRVQQHHRAGTFALRARGLSGCDLAELAHLDTLGSDQLLRQSPAVLDNLFERLDLDPPQAPAKGSKVVPFKTVISEWARERKVAPPGERSYTAKAERFVAFIREHHRAADADDMARVSPEEVIDYKNELLKTDLDHDTIGNHFAALRTLFRMPSAIGKSLRTR